MIFEKCFYDFVAELKLLTLVSNILKHIFLLVFEFLLKILYFSLSLSVLYPDLIHEFLLLFRFLLYGIEFNLLIKQFLFLPLPFNDDCLQLLPLLPKFKLKLSLLFYPFFLLLLCDLALVSSRQLGFHFLNDLLELVS